MVRPVNESSDASGEDQGQQTANQFPVFVDYDDAEDPSTLKSLHIRNWVLSERVFSIMTEALTGCPNLTCIK